MTNALTQPTTVINPDNILRRGTFLHTLDAEEATIDFYEVDDLLVELQFDKRSEELLSILTYNIHTWLKQTGSHRLQPRLVLRGQRPETMRHAA